MGKRVVLDDRDGPVHASMYASWHLIEPFIHSLIRVAHHPSAVCISPFRLTEAEGGLIEGEELRAVEREKALAYAVGTGGWVDGGMEGWMHGGTDGWMDAWMDE